MKKVCKRCGSTDIRKDAWAIWDENSGEWILGEIFDNEFCEACEGETTIIDIEE
jgi:hypothetical protein